MMESHKQGPFNTENAARNKAEQWSKNGMWLEPPIHRYPTFVPEHAVDLIMIYETDDNGNII